MYGFSLDITLGGQHGNQPRIARGVGGAVKFGPLFCSGFRVQGLGFRVAIFGVSLEEGNNSFDIHYTRRLRQEVLLLHLNRKIETQQLSYELRTKFRLEGTYRGLCRVFSGGPIKGYTTITTIFVQGSYDYSKVLILIIQIPRITRF